MSPKAARLRNHPCPPATTSWLGRRSAPERPQGTSWGEHASITVTDASSSQGHVTTLITLDTEYQPQHLTHTIRHRTAGVLILTLALMLSGCDEPRSRHAPPQEEDESPALYQAEVDEGLGAAVAILVDTSGSMKDPAPGDERSKAVVAREALEAMLDATESFVATHPGFAVKIGIYNFSSHASTVMPIQAFDRVAVRDALSRLPRPGGGTAHHRPAVRARGGRLWRQPGRRGRLDEM